MKSVFLRVSALILCMFFAFAFIAKPVTVSANTATATYVVTYLGEAVSVSAPALAVLMPIIALGICTVSLYAAVEMTYEMLSTEEIISNWANTMSTGISEGMVVTIPSEVQEYLKNKAKQNGQEPPDKLPLMVIPPNFTNLDSIDLDQIFSSSVDNSDVLEEIDTTLKQNNGLLNEIKTSLSNLAGSVEAGFEKMTAKIIEWGSSINYNTGQLLIQCKGWISDVNSNVVKFGRDTVDWLKNINSNMNHYYNKLETKLDSIFSGGGVTVPPILTDAMDGANNAEDAAKGDVQQGQDQAIHYIGRGKDLVKSYGSAFLAVGAVFSAFGSVSVFSDLLEFSLALGIFALLVNLGTSVYRSNSTRSAASKKGG